MGIFISGIKILIKFIHPYRVSKFLKLKGKGKIAIKDPEYRGEFEILDTVIAEGKTNGQQQEEKKIVCPGCGTSYNGFKDFCNSCGKDLRIFYIKE